MMQHSRLDRPVKWSPARAPARAPLAGDCILLEPLDPDRHAVDLFEAGRGPRAADLWTYMAYGPFPDLEAFRAWLEACAASDDPLFLVVVDTRSGRPCGMASYMRITPEMGVIEIGNIWFAPALQRTRGATEAVWLLARHAFDDLGYRRLEWKCDALNARSRRAAMRFGFTFEGIFRQHMVIKGRNRDTAWFAIIDRDWQAIRASFERWLSATNFDAQGRQKVALSALNQAR